MNLDDLQLSPDNTEISSDDYAAPAAFAPPPDGTYTFRLLDADIDRDQQTGEIRSQKDDQGHIYPTLLIKSVEIVEGELAGRKVYPFQYLYTKPFMRQTAQGEKLASNLVDFVRAFTLEPFKGVNEGLVKVKEQLERGTPFSAHLRWTAWDTEHAKVLREQGMDKKAVNKACSIRGMRKFTPNPSGGYFPEVVGPSGNTLEAKVELNMFVSVKA